MHKNILGFSLVELLVTCSVLAIVAAIAFMAYGNIAKNAQLVAQNKDQAVAFQLFSVFQGSGGNVAAIAKIAAGATDPNDILRHRQAVALTKLVQGDLTTDQWTVYNSNKTLKGTVALGLPKDLIVIPDPSPTADDGHSRIYIDSNNRFQLANTPLAQSIAGLVVVQTSSALGQKEQAYLSSNATVTDSADRNVTNILKKQSLSGSKFADANAYIWNEDGNAYGRPDVTGTDHGGGGQQIISSCLTVTITIDSTEIPDLSKCTYWQYMAGHVQLQIARFDANDNSPMDLTDTSAISKVTAQIGTGPVLTLANFVSATAADGVTKIIVSDPAKLPLLRDILPPVSWINATDTLQVAVTPKDMNTSAGSATKSITISPLALQLAVTNTDTDGVFSGSDAIQFKVAADATGHAITAADGIVASITLTDKGGSTVTETYDASSLTDTIKP